MDGPHLPAVGVPGELKVHAVLGGPVDRARLVGHEDHRARGVAVAKGRFEVGAGLVRDVALLDDEVVDARQVEARQLDARVREADHAELGHAVVPFVGAHVVFGVPGHEVGPVACLESRERVGRVPDLVGLVAGEVADERDEVGLGPVDLVDDALAVAAAADRREVGVADDGDPVAVELPREAGQGDGDRFERRRAIALVQAVADGGDGECGSAESDRA